MSVTDANMTWRADNHLNVGRSLVHSIIIRILVIGSGVSKTIVTLIYTQSTCTQERNEFPEENVSLLRKTPLIMVEKG